MACERRRRPKPGDTHAMPDSQPTRRWRLALSLGMLALSLLACATFRAPGDPAPTRPPSDSTPTATQTVTPTATHTPAPLPSLTPTVVERLTETPTSGPTPIAGGAATPIVVPPPSSR